MYFSVIFSTKSPGLLQSDKPSHMKRRGGGGVVGTCREEGICVSTTLPPGGSALPNALCLGLPLPPPAPWLPGCAFGLFLHLSSFLCLQTSLISKRAFRSVSDCQAPATEAGADQSGTFQAQLRCGCVTNTWHDIGHAESSFRSAKVGRKCEVPVLLACDATLLLDYLLQLSPF